MCHSPSKLGFKMFEMTVLVGGHVFSLDSNDSVQDRV